MFRTNANPHLF